MTCSMCAHKVTIIIYMQCFCIYNVMLSDSQHTRTAIGCEHEFKSLSTCTKVSFYQWCPGAGKNTYMQLFTTLYCQLF